MTSEKKIKNPYAGKGWIKHGIGYAAFMYVFMVIIYPLMFKEDFSLTRILVGIPIWLLAGLLYGYVMKKVMENKERKDMEKNTDKDQ